MTIFVKENKKVLFIHIPKTGGTSIEKWFQNYFEMSFFSHSKLQSMSVTPQHLTAVDYDTLFHPNFFDYIFTVVRNPYSRIESEYRMSQKINRKDFFGTHVGFSLWLDLIFSEYKDNNFINDNHIRPQSEFIPSNVEIFKYENGIDNIIKKICKKFDISPEEANNIPHELNTKSNSDPINWSPADLEKVFDFYRSDFELFQYDKHNTTII